MANFLASLWDSVFTPGPTPALLLATNLAFASLALLLLALLLATRSAHFAALLILSTGLWWAINWFSRELAAANAKEDEAARIREERQRQQKGQGQGQGRRGKDIGKGAVVLEEVAGGSGAEDEEGTETETEVSGKRMTTRRRRGKGVDEAKVGLLGVSASGTESMGASSELLKRKSLSDAGELSTDSEWEKVEDEEEKK